MMCEEKNSKEVHEALEKTVEDMCQEIEQLQKENEQLQKENEQLRAEVANQQSLNNALKETIVRNAMLNVGTMQIGG